MHLVNSFVPNSLVVPAPALATKSPTVKPRGVWWGLWERLDALRTAFVRCS